MQCALLLCPVHRTVHYSTLVWGQQLTGGYSYPNNHPMADHRCHGTIRSTVQYVLPPFVPPPSYPILPLFNAQLW